MLCPALVRTAMSDHGEDPLDVADAALAAVDAGRFLVMPSEWSDALTARANQLADGNPSPGAADRRAGRNGKVA